MDLIIRYIPHPKQRVFHEDQSKFRLICTGVGFGKTAAGVIELIRQCIKSPAGCVFAVVTPTYKMLDRVTFPEFFKFCPPQLIRQYNKSTQEITLINKVKIIGVAGDIQKHIDRLRGITIAGGYGDEIALCPEYLHHVLIARLRDARGPLKIWYTTTPKGFNWLHRIFVEKKNTKGEPLKKPEEYKIFGGRTRDNPYTPETYKLSMEDMYGGEFSKQELEGEFVGYEGLVYKDFRRHLHVFQPEELDGFGIKEWISGVDFGFTNPSVALLIGVDGDGRCYVTKEIYQRRLLIDDLINMIKEWKKAFGFFRLPRVYADPSEPMLIRQMNREGVMATKAKNEVIKGINVVTAALATAKDGRPRLFFSEECRETINEIMKYRYVEEQEDREVKDSPLKVDDHAMDALRYALYSYDKRSKGYKPILA